MKNTFKSILKQLGLYNSAKSFYQNIRPISENVIVGGMECTGSTFVCQIVKEMGFKPKKIHEYYNKNNILKLITFRDPRDIICSFARRTMKEMVDAKGLEEALIASHKYLFLHHKRHEDLRRYSQEQHSLLIRYEDYFVGNEGNLIDQLAEFLKVDIDDSFKLFILLEYSIEKNKQRASKFSSFQEYDKDTLIHGNHLSSNGMSKVWKELFTPAVCEITKRDLGDFLIEYGYESNLDW